MIFISHNSKDKPLVGAIALRLSNVLGQENVFYDSWSIQPGDGIIDKMNEGLEKCKFFFFFVSKNSLQSKMVGLEWQNALFKATKNQIKLIPVKIDDCLMPALLLQTLYIDVYGKGLEVAIRQMIDVVNGKNTFISEGPQQFQNVRAYCTGNKNIVNIEIRAEFYMEPISKYLIVFDNKESEIDIKVKSDSVFYGGFNNNVKLSNGEIYKGFFVSVERATVPGFPMEIEITPLNNNKLKLLCIMRAINKNDFAQIPLI